MKKDNFDFLLDEENSLASIDDVITLLLHAHDSFHLGNTSLTEAEQYDFLSHHDDLGCILRIAIKELGSAYSEFEEVHRKLMDSFPADVAERLVAARGEKNLTEICQAVGISEEALTAYESGQREPRDEVKLKLAEYYGKSLNELFF